MQYTDNGTVVTVCELPTYITTCASNRRDDNREIRPASLEFRLMILSHSLANLLQLHDNPMHPSIQLSS